MTSIREKKRKKKRKSGAKWKDVVRSGRWVGASSTKEVGGLDKRYESLERERERETVVEEAIAVVEREPRTAEGREGKREEKKNGRGSPV